MNTHHNFSTSFKSQLMMLRGMITLTIFVLALPAFGACVYEQAVSGENLQIGTMLTWSTSFEENNSMFIIEKSEDGSTFETIGSVEGNGDVDELSNYNFLDVMATSEKSYYRLKQVDFDGSFSYSDVVSITRQFKNNFMVARMSAVATTDVFEVTIDALQNGEMDYNLANLKGEVMLQDQLLVIDGLNDLTIDLSDQREGIYKLNLEMDGEKEVLVIKKVLDEIKKASNVASKDDAPMKGKN